MYGSTDSHTALAKNSVMIKSKNNLEQQFGSTDYIVTILYPHVSIKILAHFYKAESSNITI